MKYGFYRNRYGELYRIRHSDMPGYVYLKNLHNNTESHLPREEVEGNIDAGWLTFEEVWDLGSDTR